MINPMERAFNRTYPKYMISKVTPYSKTKIFILAKTKDGSEIMDPFYVYDKEERKFYSYQPLVNFKEFEDLMSRLRDYRR